MQPGDFLVSTIAYNGNQIFAIFEGHEIYSTTYTSSNPDYSLLAHYESKPYQYSYHAPTGPTLEIATQGKPCSHKIYIKENPTTWRKCTDEEKAEFINILAQHGYYWIEDTWELVESETGQIVASITQPKLIYNGCVCKHISESAHSYLQDKCAKEAESIFMPIPISTTSYHQSCYSEVW